MIRTYFINSCLIIGFCISNLAMATTLIVPEEFEVMRVNGEEYSSTLLATETKVELSTGQNVLVLKYVEMFDDDMEDHHITVRSKPFIILFSIGNESKLTFSYPKQADSIAARIYAKQPSVSIIAGNNTKLALINQSLNSYNDEVMKKTMQRRENIVKQSLVQEDNSRFQKQAPNSLEMLKFWWQQASEEDKTKFVEHIQDSQQ